MDSYGVASETYDPQSCKDAFSMINTRQTIALMFHDEMADLFDFMGLCGFKKMHEYQYMVEASEHRKLKWYYLNHHNMLLPDEEIHSVDVIPDDWYRYTRMDVTPAIKKQYTQKAFELYYNWEMGTKALYEKCAARLMAWGKVADFNRINCLIWDVTEELKWLESLMLQLKSVDYEVPYLESIQDKYYKMYEEKYSKIGETLY